MSTGLVIAQGKKLYLVRYNRSFKHVDIDFLPNTPVPHKLSAAGATYAVFSHLEIDADLSIQQKTVYINKVLLFANNPLKVFLGLNLLHVLYLIGKVKWSQLH